MFASFSKALRASRGKKSSRPVSLRLEALESRTVLYSASANSWLHPQLITLSFVPDGTILSGTTGSNLFASFNAKFGSAAVWENIILKAAQTWAAQTNLNISVVADNGAAIGSGSYQQGDPNMGDIRIGGYAMATSNVLAQAYMPQPANNQSAAGDLQFNTAMPFKSGSTYDLFTVAAHEIGHALGLNHSSVNTAVMYSSYTGVKSVLTQDDINGIQSIYGSGRSADQYSGTNSSFSTAANLNSGINQTAGTAAINNLNLTSIGSAEYFTFTAPASTTGTLSLTVQSAGLSLLSPAFTVYGADQSTVLGSASGAGQYGATLTANLTGVTPGEVFYVKVSGVDSTVFSTGAYGMTLNFGSGSNVALTVPNTTTANGNPLTGGGGIAAQVQYEAAVSTSTSYTKSFNAQTPNAVAMTSNGNYVVVWSSQNQDGSGLGVYGRLFNSSGTALGSEFRVNTTTSGDQTNPAVASDSQGNFVVTWSSYGQDGSGWGIYAQRYNSSGVAQGSEFRVNTTTSGDQEYSSIDMDANGNFVISWSSNGQDGSGWGVYAQRYNSSGVAQGSEFRVNSTTSGDQMYSNVGMNTSGAFVITWQSNGQDGSGWGIYAQRYNSSGVAQGNEFLVNTTTSNNQEFPAVALDSSGDFTITWSSYLQDGSGWGVYAQRYNSSGVAQGGEFRVNTTTSGDQMYSRVSMDTYGNSFVTWQSNGQDGSGWGVYAQEYDLHGNGLGTEFIVNTTTSGDQQFASVAENASGNAIVVWSGNGTGDAAGIFMQPYTLNTEALDLLTIDPNYSADTAAPVVVISHGALPALERALASDEGSISTAFANAGIRSTNPSASMPMAISLAPTAASERFSDAMPSFGRKASIEANLARDAFLEDGHYLSSEAAPDHVSDSVFSNSDDWMNIELAGTAADSGKLVRVAE